MEGTRVEYDGNGPLPAPGFYWKQRLGHWECVTPNGLYGTLAGHHVVENGNGTITVSPSILVTLECAGNDRDAYHGYLTKGEWKP